MQGGLSKEVVSDEGEVSMGHTTLRMKSAFAQNLSMLGPKYVPNTCTFSSWFLCRRKELRASV